MAGLTGFERDEVANRRLRKRHQLLFNIAVIDSRTKEELGRVVDISSEGIMLSSPAQDVLQTYSSLTFVIPKAMDGFRNIVFDAELRWHKKDMNPQYELLGLEVTHPLQEYKSMFQEIVRRYSLETI